MPELHCEVCVYTRTGSSPLTRKLFRGQPKRPVAGGTDLPNSVSSGDGERRMPFPSGCRNHRLAGLDQVFLVAFDRCCRPMSPQKIGRLIAQPVSKSKKDLT